MSFEIREKDLLARTGRLTTKSGTVETPLLFPVVNPVIQPIPPKRMREEFGYEAVITNAYILRKRDRGQPVGNSVHKVLDFTGTVMTDSGAYQILIYGDVEVTPKEIIQYQEEIGSDIATILDIPTGWEVTERDAGKTVKETLKRAKDLFKQKTRDDILWAGPVQGGRYLRLVTKSAQEMGKLPFDTYALGSPTEVMERYRFDVLAEMIITAKMNLPIEKPLHLFGAGHPFMFAFAVALGCDFFDSAAYTLYAKQDRYMTESGTSRLSRLEHFPCCCPRCIQTTPDEVAKLPPKERQVFLAEHNLYVCAAELRRIKQSIKEGRLWELVQLRSHGHPSLLQALKKLQRHKEFIEEHDTAVKNSGLFFFDSTDLTRPEIVRHQRRLIKRQDASQRETLLLIPQTETKPYHKSREFKHVAKQLQKTLGQQTNNIDISFYTAPFGIVPYELDEVYPLSQHETVIPPDEETKNYVASQVAEYISRKDYKTILLITDTENWGKAISKAARKACLNKNVNIQCADLSRKKDLEQLLQNIMKK